MATCLTAPTTARSAAAGDAGLLRSPHRYLWPVELGLTAQLAGCPWSPSTPTDFECDHVDRGTPQLKAQLMANTTEVRRDGKWLCPVGGRRQFPGGGAVRVAARLPRSFRRSSVGEPAAAV